MGMTTKVKGYVSPENENYKKHANVLIACVNANISELPKETAEYFGCKYPDLSLLDEKLEMNIKKHEYSEDMVDGYEIYIHELPKGIYKIRFTNNY